MTSIEDAIRPYIHAIGDDPTREGLADTPHRVARAAAEWFAGYHEDPASVLKTFADGAEGVDEMVVAADIPFYSHCEHHLAPFFGVASIGYLPRRRVVGLSKLNRLVGLYSRRLQVQERLTVQLADAIDEHLSPRGVGVLVRARHLCIESRGVNHRGGTTTTSALRGRMRDLPSCRGEFLALATTQTPL